MVETCAAVLVVGAGPALRLRMDELEYRFDYRICFAKNPYEAASHLEKQVVQAVVCEAAPSYTAECRFLRELSQRSARHPVVLYVEPDEEEALMDLLGNGNFYVVRPRATLEEIHRVIKEAIEKARLRQGFGGQARHAKVA